MKKVIIVVGLTFCMVGCGKEVQKSNVVASSEQMDVVGAESIEESETPFQAEKVEEIEYETIGGNQEMYDKFIEVVKCGEEKAKESIEMLNSLVEGNVTAFTLTDKTEYFTLDVVTDADFSYHLLVGFDGTLEEIRCNETGERKALMIY